MVTSLLHTLRKSVYCITSDAYRSGYWGDVEDREENINAFTKSGQMDVKFGPDIDWGISPIDYAMRLNIFHVQLILVLYS